MQGVEPLPGEFPKASSFVGMAWNDIKIERIPSLSEISATWKKKKKKKESLVLEMFIQIHYSINGQIPKATGISRDEYILLCRYAQDRKCTCGCECVWACVCMWVYTDIKIGGI